MKLPAQIAPAICLAVELSMVEAFALTLAQAVAQAEVLVVALVLALALALVVVSVMALAVKLAPLPPTWRKPSTAPRTRQSAFWIPSTASEGLPSALRKS
jgi:hypothetical protein